MENFILRHIVMLLFAVAFIALDKLIDKFIESIRHISTITDINGLTVVFDCDRCCKAYLKKGLKMMPSFILDKFIEEQYTVYVLCDESFNERYGDIEEASHTLGYYCAGNKEIVLRERKSRKEFLSTLHHEFGHFIDSFCCYGFYSDGYRKTYASVHNEAINEAYKIAKEQYSGKIGEYYLSSESEFFAYLSSGYFGHQRQVDESFNTVFEDNLLTAFERAL